MNFKKQWFFLLIYQGNLEETLLALQSTEKKISIFPSFTANYPFSFLLCNDIECRAQRTLISIDSSNLFSFETKKLVFAMMGGLF